MVPAFLVVDQPPQTILDFAGATTIRQTVVIASDGLLCPDEDDPGLRPCVDYAVRLPGAGQLDTKLNWRVELMDDVIARPRLRVDHPVQAKSGDMSPLELVSSGDAGDLIHITIVGPLYFGGGMLTLTFSPR